MGYKNRVAFYFFYSFEVSDLGQLCLFRVKVPKWHMGVNAWDGAAFASRSLWLSSLEGGRWAHVAVEMREHRTSQGHVGSVAFP